MEILFSRHAGFFSKGLLLLTITILCLSPSFSQGKYLLDTFQDDTVGKPPNGPEIGSATYGGSSGVHTVVNLGGSDLRLRSVDNSSGGSLLISYYPIGSPDVIPVSYKMRVETGSILVAQNAFSQQLTLLPSGTNLILDWGNDKKFYVRISRPSKPTETIGPLSSWIFDFDYQISWSVDTVNNRFSVDASGTSLLEDQPIGVNVTKLSGLYFSTNYNTTGSQVIDNVTIDRSCDGPCIWYVDSGASGNNSGESWTNALNKLQDALFAVKSGDTVLVAAGTYKPDQGGGNSPGDREATFQLKSGVTIEGGYAGSSGPDPDVRDIAAYETVLSGDIGIIGVNSDNSYHVLTGSGTDETALLDGFTVTAGYATGTNPTGQGGGIYIGLGSPTLSNCMFINNTAVRGGAVSNPSYSSKNPSFIKCKFISNSAGVGGAVESQGGAPSFTNCIFSGNVSTNSGGGLFNMGNSNATLTNCTLSGNSADVSGGGIYNSWATASVTVLNCILWANSDSGGIDESAQIHNDAGAGVPVVDYSCIEGWSGSLGGTGNIGADPCFVDADGADNIVGTEDDNLRLLLGSPCIDTGHPGPAYQDPDGSRNDMGAYGGPYGELTLGGTHPGTGFVFTTIGNIPTSEIPQRPSDHDPCCAECVGLADVNSTVADMLGIYPYKDSPFGGTLWIHGLFGENDNVDYYQILVGKWKDGNQPAPQDYVTLGTPLTKVEYYVDPCGIWTYRYVNLGPKTIMGADGNDIDNLYKLTDEGYWSYIDLRIRWNTAVYENGKYTLTYKAYRWADPCETALVDANLAPTGWDNIILVVDNSPVAAEIHSVKYDPCSPYYSDPCDGEVPECAIINLSDANENLRFTITASHPNGYLRYYVLDALYGKNRYGGVITSDSYSPPPYPYWDGVTQQEFQSADSAALEPWQQCAYQFRLRVYSRATNGYYHIISKEFNDHYFLDLGISTCWGADLDHSGQVNFKDFALFAQQWLESCGP